MPKASAPGYAIRRVRVFRDAPVRLKPDETIHAFCADNLFARSSPDLFGIEVRSYFPCSVGKG